MVIALICLVFFGVFQISQMFAAQEVLSYAAGRGLRAKTVGFNQFMVFKTVRIGAIPNAGRLINPGYAGGPAAEEALEHARIPLYLAGEEYGQLPAILDYEFWNTPNEIDAAAPVTGLDGTLHLDISQDYPLQMPFHRAFYGGDSVTLHGQADLDDHFPLYMTDEGF